MTNSIILTDSIVSQKIYTVRGIKVMIDHDLAELYGTQTKVLNQSVKRNLKRFPEDFMFQLTEDEFFILRSQFVTSNSGGRRTLPYVFTEQGVAMLSSVLKSDTAIEVNIQIIRIFSRIREIVATKTDVLLKLEKVENRLLVNQEKVCQHEEEIALIFKYLKQLLNPKKVNREKIGY